MSKEIKIQETNNKNTSLLKDTYPECICSNCLCGKRSCFICGSGTLPLYFELCKIHDFCSAGLEGCFETSVYIVNGKKQSLFASGLSGDYLCLEVNFLCISNDLIFLFNNLLEKYQIKISRYMCGNYIKNFFEENSCELSLMANKIKNGLNDNEVIVVPKNIENKGFFEKFFQLFS